MFWTTVTSQTSSEKSGRTDIQSNRLLCLAQERDSQKGRARFRVFTASQAWHLLEPLGTIPPAPPERVHGGNVAPASQTQAQDHTTAEPADATNADEEAEEEEGNTYVVPEGPAGLVDKNLMCFRGIMPYWRLSAAQGRVVLSFTVLA